MPTDSKATEKGKLVNNFWLCWGSPSHDTMCSSSM